MKLSLLRYSNGEEDTLGLLHVDCQFVAYTLEDQFQTKKVYGETRIPEGTYRITFREEGGFHKRYKSKFPDIHKGMLWIRDIPNFEYVLIHIGNDDDDTAGCVLVGDTTQHNIGKKGFIGASTPAYKRLYPMVAKALESGEPVTIEIKTM